MRFIVIPGAELAGAMHHGLLRNGPITIAIRARFEYDSTTIRLQHATRFFVRSHTRSYTRISGNGDRACTPELFI